MAGPEDELAQEAFASSGSYTTAGVEARRRNDLEHLQEFCSEQPTDKRPRLQGDFLDGDAAGAGAGSREAALHGWSEELVRTLHGCPSVEEAAQRCARVLAAFEVDVRQAALREGDAREGGPESVQSLQHTKKVLMRAVNHLAQRCRQAEAGAAEVDSLKEELEKSKEGQRRLQHHNEMLQCHLKLHLDSCR